MNIINIEISTKPIIAGRSGISTKNGQPYSIPSKQIAYIHQGDDYPSKLEVVVPDTGPYRPGRYLLAGEAFVPTERGVRFDDRAVALVSVSDALKQLQELIKAFDAAPARA